jgi:hypothetical protein
LSLNWFLRGFKELSKAIIAVSIKAVLTINLFQLIILKELLPFSLSTTWRTSTKHHRPLGFLFAQSQSPDFFSIAIFAIIVD